MIGLEDGVEGDIVGFYWNRSLVAIIDGPVVVVMDSVVITI